MYKQIEELKLKNQLCFPIYATSNLIIKMYKPFLDEIDLSYTQYITMMVLWEKTAVGMKELGELLYLSPGTLTPILKKLETKGYIERLRLEEDERNVAIITTDKGDEIKNKAKNIPKKIAQKFNLEPKEAEDLYRILYKILNSSKEE